MDGQSPQPVIQTSKHFFQRRFFLIIIGIILTVLVLSYMFFVHPLIQKKGTLPVDPNKEKLLTTVDLVIEDVKNPDYKLLESYQVKPEEIKTLQNSLIYGADPETIMDQKKFLPDSLMGIKDLIGKGEYKEAQKKIRNEEGGFRTGVYPLLLTTGLSTHPDYSVRLDPDEAARIDPEKRFHSLRLSVPRPFENAAKGLIQLHYDLGTL